MDISDILSTKFTEFDIGTPLSKAAGAFENQELDAIVVTDGDDYRGVVSRRQLAASSTQLCESRVAVTRSGRYRR